MGVEFIHTHINSAGFLHIHIYFSPKGDFLLYEYLML